MTDRKRKKGNPLPPDWVELNKVDPALQANVLGRMEEFFHRLGGGDRPQPEVARWEDDIIEHEIADGSSVLDLGCGDGTLLRRLIDTRHVRGQGVEVDPKNVARCVAIGAPVFQVDVEEGLRGLGEDCFDYVILEETLQTLTRPVETLREMLRVGRRGIVSFPNFGYWRVRLDLMVRGRMPKTEWLPFQWYDTPNIHIFTLQDFLDRVAEEGITVEKGFVLREGVVDTLDPEGDNLAAEEVLMVLSLRR